MHSICVEEQATGPTYNNLVHIQHINNTIINTVTPTKIMMGGTFQQQKSYRYCSPQETSRTRLHPAFKKEVGAAGRARLFRASGPNGSKRSTRQLPRPSEAQPSKQPLTHTSCTRLIRAPHASCHACHTLGEAFRFMANNGSSSARFPSECRRRKARAREAIVLTCK